MEIFLIPSGGIKIFIGGKSTSIRSECMNTIERIFLAGVLGAGLATVTPVRALGIGPLLGANFANADLGDHNSHSITGWAVGARLETGIMPLLSLHLDPMLVKSGADFSSSSSGVSGHGDFILLEVPVLLNARLSLLNLGIYGFLGPDLIFTTDATGSFSETDDLKKSKVSSTSLAGDVGAGVAFAIAPFIELSADARYIHGFTDMLDQSIGDVQHWRTRDVRLTLGVLLHSPR